MSGIVDEILPMKVSVLAAVLLLCVLPLAAKAQEGKHRVRVCVDCLANYGVCRF